MSIFGKLVGGTIGGVFRGISEGITGKKAKQERKIEAQQAETENELLLKSADRQDKILDQHLENQAERDRIEIESREQEISLQEQNGLLMKSKIEQDAIFAENRAEFEEQLGLLALQRAQNLNTLEVETTRKELEMKYYVMGSVGALILVLALLFVPKSQNNQ